MNSCMHHAITFTHDSEGFEVPVVGSDCVNCGLCLKKCHAMADEQRHVPIAHYIAITKQNLYYETSASGGIFTTLAHAFLDAYPGARVCGAAFYKGQVKHIVVDNHKDLALLANSKYVQSSINDSLKEVKELLKHGVPVLFCGTPCQIQGVKKYTSDINDLLFTIDLICHGVPSPLFFKRNIDSYSLRYLKNVSFRWKSVLFKSSSFFGFGIKK